MSLPYKPFERLRHHQSIRLPDVEHVEYTVQQVFPKAEEHKSSWLVYWTSHGRVVAEAIHADEGSDWFLRLSRRKDLKNGETTS